MRVVLVSTYMYFSIEFYPGGRIFEKRQKRHLVCTAFSLHWMDYFPVPQFALLQDYPGSHFNVHQRGFLYLKTN
jgi:hypothetical protein